jgi:FHS family glucose/mannose:H+ symporter-like MFS transporter
MEASAGKSEGRPTGVRSLMASACAGIFVFGIVMAILGAILPSLFSRIQFSKSEAGNLFFYMNLAMLAMSVFFGPVVDRFGYKVFLLICSLLVAASLVLFNLASTYSFLILAAVLIGLGGGGLNGGTNALTSDIYPERRSAALLGIFFGFGAVAVPFLIGALLGTIGLQAILAVATVLSLIPFALFLALRFPAAKQAQGFPLRQAARIIGHPLLWLCGFLLFFESGNEFTVGGWTSTYLNEYFRLSPTQAALVLAGFWAAIMAGRLIVTRLVRFIRNEILVLGSAVVALSAAVIMAASPSGGLAALGAVLIGLGFAAIYPTTLAIVGEAFPALSGTAFSVVFVIGLAGGMTAPWLTGKVAAASSLRQGFYIPVVCSAMIIMLQVAIMRLLRARRVR